MYINGIVSSLSEVFAYLCSGVMIDKLGIKFTFIFSFLVAIAGMSGVISSKEDGHQVLMCIYILGSKFGIS